MNLWKGDLMKLLAVCLGRAQPTPGRKSARTGIFKQPVDHAVMVGLEGLAGDRIVNRVHHGGPDQAVYIEGAEDLDWWSRELGYPVPPGTFGENLTVEGLENREVAVGDRLEIGDVLLEVTSARIPCATFALRMNDPKFVKRYTAAARPGAYARVLREGVLRAGDLVVHQPFAGERITMPDLLRTYRKPLGDAERARQLATPISERLRRMLTQVA